MIHPAQSLVAHLLGANALVPLDESEGCLVGNRGKACPIKERKRFVWLATQYPITLADPRRF